MCATPRGSKANWRGDRLVCVCHKWCTGALDSRVRDTAMKHPRATSERQAKRDGSHHTKGCLWIT